jgi:hypothetical protein
MMLTNDRMRVKDSTILMMVSRRKFWMITAAVPVIVMLVIFGMYGVNQFLVTQARREWKTQAIARISDIAIDPQRIQREKDLLVGKADEADGEILADGWLSRSMILMSNGEWLMYQNHCPKEVLRLPVKTRRPVSDIFIAKGSNGKWYYSTCHFCVDMMALIGFQDDPPADIVSFAQRYHLVEFDGQSDDCLRKTESVPRLNP